MRDTKCDHFVPILNIIGTKPIIKQKITFVKSHLVNLLFNREHKSVKLIPHIFTLVYDYQTQVRKTLILVFFIVGFISRSTDVALEVFSSYSEYV